MCRAFLLFVGVLKISYQSISTESFQTTSRFKRQSENHCVLPPHPANGEIKILAQEHEFYFPNNEVVLNTIIDLSCMNGTVTKTGGLSRAICNRGKWEPPISQMECVRRCPQVQTGGRMVCTHKNPKINCNNPIEGTTIQADCGPFYEAKRPIVTCRNGSWDGDVHGCQLECGKIQITPEPKTIDGNSVYPWVAGIYKSNGTEYIGGATVISKHFVLSVAQHFISPDFVPRDINDYIVTAGKDYQDFHDTRETNMQSSRIKRIHVPKAYRNNAGDLAILALETPFRFTEHVQPVCIDWTNHEESSDLKEVNRGTTTGWEEKNLSKKLQALNVPYVSKNLCPIPFEGRKFFTQDKFCAGYGDGHTILCSGYTGAGLFFKNPDSRFYIRGILSAMPDLLDTCGTGDVALYTKISTYLEDIRKEVSRVL